MRTRTSKMMTSLFNKIDSGPRVHDSFGQPRRPLKTLRRQNLAVRPIRSANASRSASPDRAAQAPDPAPVAEAKRRFAICQTCEHSRDNAFACALYSGCCFGRYRSDPSNACPARKW